MTYLNSRDGYQMTQAEIDALPSWHEAGNRPAVGMYRTVSVSTHEPAVIEVVSDPLTKTREVFNRVRLVRDAILSPLDEEFQFSKY